MHTQDTITNAVSAAIWRLEVGTGAKVRSFDEVLGVVAHVMELPRTPITNETAYIIGASIESILGEE